jgi:hypothetical protein
VLRAGGLRAAARLLLSTSENAVPANFREHPDKALQRCVPRPRRRSHPHLLSRQPSLVILLTMARAPACSGRAATRRDAPQSMGTARKVGKELRQRHGGPPGDDSSCQPQFDSRLLARRGGEADTRCVLTPYI